MKRHIYPLLFDVIDDKPEWFIMYKHEPVGRWLIHYRINYEMDNCTDVGREYCRLRADLPDAST